MSPDLTYVHFRYYDVVGGLIGHHRWRYERIKRSDVEAYARDLSKRGFGEFSWRALDTYTSIPDTWHHVEITV